MNKQILISFFLLFLHFQTTLGQPFIIDTRISSKQVVSDSLKMGGRNFIGEKININSYYLSIDGRPAIPVTGEFHYSRYPNQFWNEEIRKMKAGGINIIATYVFWNIHEETEGYFNWEGDNNLRKFIELCAANNVKVILRIGPFCHGEIRNGALPDWLPGKPLTIRSNDPVYLKYVDRFYKQTGQQVEGLLFKDGGPVFAIQIENEYQHSAAPWGLTYPGQPYDMTSAERDRNIIQEGVGISEEANPYARLGNEHMKVLKALASKNGLNVPIYTATGWGNAAVIENETLPVTAAYAYPAWAPPKVSSFYLYTDLQKHPDYSPVRYQSENYPYFAAEIGGGIMNTYSRRPVVPAKSLEALINRFLGSGANGIGYYMYHGGITPKGKLFFFSDEAYGYPKISYDFQAPLSAFGKPSASFNQLKILHDFIHAFGDILAPMQVVLPVDPSSIDPADPTVLRYSMRVGDHEGFLFLNNFQDHAERKDITNIQFKILLDNKEIVIPEKHGFTLGKDENAILPVNLSLGSIRLNYATAQLLTRGRDEQGEFLVFFAPDGISPEFSFPVIKGQTISGTNCRQEKNKERCLVHIEKGQTAEIRINTPNKLIRILILNKNSALNSWIIKKENHDKLIITKAMAIKYPAYTELISGNNNVIDFNLYPAGDDVVASTGKLTRQTNSNDLWDHFRISLPAEEINFPAKQTGNKLVVDLSSGMPNGINDIICRINYIGDTGQGFINGKLVIDNFYKGIPWEISLKNFMQKPDTKEMVFYFRPMYKDAPFLQDLPKEAIPVFDRHGRFLRIEEPEFFPEYKVKIVF
jgi:beta-galactosidase